MQLMTDAVGVLGGKHGLVFDPARRTCAVVRTDKYSELPELSIRAGAVIGGREIILPLSPDGETFAFCDQRMTPCSMSIMGVDPESQIKIKLTVFTPFRPQDADFSTTPVLHLKLEIEQLQGGFRWETRKHYLDEAEFFIEFAGPKIRTEDSGPDSMDLIFNSGAWTRRPELPRDMGLFTIYDRSDSPQRDRLVVLSGNKTGNRVSRKVAIPKTPGEKQSLDIAWCSWQDGGITIRGERCPYRYTALFQDLDAVADWARKNPLAIPDNAAKVDGIVMNNNLDRPFNRLAAYSLHSWLLNTVWTRRGNREIFSVWEGNCYFLSTVDVEYTQAPFYLSVWPELLKYELDLWPEFSRSGEETLGERGKGTLFLSHDMGTLTVADGQDYPHDMEVEETTNYVILSWLYWRRTGDFSSVKRNLETIGAFLKFLRACDTTGNGVPDRGVSNTIDDASPALQFGREQVYLAVKTIAAFEAAADIDRFLKKTEQSANWKKAAAKIRAQIENKGWLGDHYAVLLDRTGKGVTHPWTREVKNYDVIPGWDSSHLFTANAAALMDLCGRDLGLNPERLVTDLRTGVRDNLAEYGCRHTSDVPLIENWKINGQIFNAYDSSWISSNVIRDMAAFYRGLDLRHMAGRYWEWQVTLNSRERMMYTDCFGGNNVSFYPRGVAVWGYFDALGGIVIDRVKGIDRAKPPFPQVRVPKLETADWKKGTCGIIGGKP